MFYQVNLANQKGESEMDREEILQRAKKERSSEYEQTVYQKILSRSVFWVMALCAFFWLVKVIHGDLAGLPQVHAYEFPAILMGYAAYVYLGTFSRLKSRWHLICGSLFALGFVIFVVQFFVHL